MQSSLQRSQRSLGGAVNTTVATVCGAGPMSHPGAVHLNLIYNSECQLQLKKKLKQIKVKGGGWEFTGGGERASAPGAPHAQQEEHVSLPILPSVAWPPFHARGCFTHAWLSWLFPVCVKADFPSLLLLTGLCSPLLVWKHCRLSLRRRKKNVLTNSVLLSKHWSLPAGQRAGIQLPHSLEGSDLGTVC